MWEFVSALDRSPSRLAPHSLLGVVQESPGHEAALFLALRHLHYSAFEYAGLFQGALDHGQVRGLRDQRAEPEDLTRHLLALVDQLRDEADFAALAPQFLGLPAEVQHRQLALGVGLAQGAPFALATALGFVQG